ncbi:MAG: type II toxin-antitoxin system HicA family toxin [Nanoarchaeota archaeon]|nr:type II toxin-antitoxin system HicA family toxin [Nanoarchaeota archaeon]MBU4299622.1 type II toxin-antitoxin system HicA family toxin [Nanoarchaeota archaeon]MBU4452612.1 type II toxin-antitoxin system HicA family toxin [Nanoarchaeota archaeon]MCG2723921.1 type II toxin-antitoxin system HicA family toxin [archaeon]
MAKLPAVSGKEVIKALVRIGYFVHHQKGSHICLKNSNSPYNRITVPNHRELKKGTLNGILKDAKLSVDELLKLL